MPHDIPATKNPIGGAIRKPPTAVNSINETIMKYAVVERAGRHLAMRWSHNLNFITYKLSAPYVVAWGASVWRML